MDGIFSGVKILDLGRYVAAPYCAALFADMGADVVKVEKPTGDEMRDGYAYRIHAFNRNKRSISIDFRKEEDKDLLKQLIAGTDVLIHNFRVGVMESMGFSYEALKEINPSIIVLAVSGYGQTGSMSNRLAYEEVIQATGGLISINGTRASGPIPINTLFMDATTAIHGALAVATALYDRERTGQGQYIDLAMQDCAVPYLQMYLPRYGATGAVQGLLGDSPPTAAPAAVFRTKDGYVFIHAGATAKFRIIAKLIGSEEMLRPECDDAIYRVNHFKELNQRMAQWVATMTTEEARQICEENGIPFGRVWNIDDMINSQWAKDRNGIIYMDIPGYGKLPYVGHPLKMKTRPVTEYRPVPEVGANNREVLEDWLHMTPEEIDALGK